MRTQLVVLAAVVACAATSLAEEPAGTGPSDEPVRIAIMDLEPRSLGKELADSVTDLLITEIASTGVFEVVERQQISKALGEQSLQMKGIVDPDQAVQIGKMLAAEKIVIGSVASFSFGKVLNVRVIDVEKGTVEVADKQIATSDEEILESTGNLALNLAAYVSGSDIRVGDRSVSSRGVAFSTIKVISAYGKTVEISAGKEDGVKAGDRFSVYMIDKMTGREKDKGTIVAKDVYPNHTKCKEKRGLSLFTSKAIIVSGDLVRKGGE